METEKYYSKSNEVLLNQKYEKINQMLIKCLSNVYQSVFKEVECFVQDYYEVISVCRWLHTYNLHISCPEPNSLFL